MGQDIIKDFVKKQTTAISIGVPKQRPQCEVKEERFEEKPDTVQEVKESEVQAPVEKATKRHVGRPKSEIEKVKMSVYVPAEAKAKLIKIQHETYKQNLNDVLLEAINDILKKYGEQ